MSDDLADPGTVTVCVDRLRSGDQAAAQTLWERYFARLIGLARGKLGRPGGIEDEEDAALSAFDSVCQGLGRGRFPDLADREDLWRLLVEITACKAFDQIERRQRKKRGGDCTFEPAEFDQLVGHEPSPEFACEVSERYEALMDALGDPDMRRVARMKMDGYTRGEIASAFNRSERTVANKLMLIRRIWVEAGLATDRGGDAGAVGGGAEPAPPAAD